MEKNALKIEIYLRKNCPYIYYIFSLCVFQSIPNQKCQCFFGWNLFFGMMIFIKNFIEIYGGIDRFFNFFFASHFLFTIYSTSFEIKKGEIHSYIFGKIFDNNNESGKCFFQWIFFFCEMKAFLCSVWTIFIGLLRWWLLKFFCELELLLKIGQISSTFELWKWKIGV